jgi:hypothetical protein
VVERAEEAVHLLRVKDLDLRIVVLADWARPAKRTAAVEAIDDEVARRRLSPVAQGRDATQEIVSSPLGA